MWRETNDGQKSVNMDMVESLSVEPISEEGRHPDDKYAVVAHLPSGESFEMRTGRDPGEAMIALRELAAELK